MKARRRSSSEERSRGEQQSTGQHQQSEETEVLEGAVLTDDEWIATQERIRQRQEREAQEDAAWEQRLREEETSRQQQAQTGDDSTVRMTLGDYIWQQSNQDRMRTDDADTAKKMWDDYNRNVEHESLQKSVVDCGKRYLESLGGSNLLGGAPVDEQERQLTQMHKGYAASMVLTCMRPLAQGISGRSVASSATMFAMMWSFSPEFKQFTGQALGSMRSNIRNQLQEVIDEKRDFANKVDVHKIAESKDGGKKYRKQRERAAKTADRWESRLNVMFGDPKGSERFTPESAALTEVGLNQRAFDALREPGVDAAGRQRIMDELQQLKGSLYKSCARDGIEPEEVSAYSRALVGRLAMEDPSYRAQYNELSHNLVRHNEGENSFMDINGGAITSGSFSVRPPMSLSEHEDELTGAMIEEMYRCRDANELRQLMGTYVVHANMGNSRTDNIADPVARNRMRWLQGSRHAMLSDGHSKEQAEFVHANAFTNLVRHIEEVNPDMRQMWVESGGPEYLDDLVSKLRPQHEQAKQERARNRPHERFKEETRRRQREQYGDADVDAAESASAKYRRHKRNVRYNEVKTGSVFGFGADDFEPAGQAWEMPADASRDDDQPEP